MEIGIATLVMLLYAVGTGYWNWSLQKHLPSKRQKHAREQHQWPAVLRIWGPTLWFVPGLVWFRVLNVPQDYRFEISVISVFLPLSIYLVFTSMLELFLYRKDSLSDAQKIYLLISGIGLVLLIFLGVMLFFSGLTLWKSLFFFVVVALPPCLSILAIAFTASKAIPRQSTNLLEHILNSLLLIFSFFTGHPKPVWVVQDGKIETRVSGKPSHGLGRGWLLTEPENVAILGNGSGPTRVGSPGVVLTAGSESPYKIVDLRNQKRSINVSAITRDGIEVDVPLSFTFRIDSGLERPGLNRPWPMRRANIFRAVSAEVVDPDGKTPLDSHLSHPWEDLPIIVATYKIKQVVAYYSLDELYEGDLDGEKQAIHERAAAALGVKTPESKGFVLMRTIIGDMILESVRNALEPHGFFIIDGGVKDSIVIKSKELTRQRVEAWKKGWTTNVMNWQAWVQAKPIAEVVSDLEEKAVERMEQVLLEMDKKAQRLDGADTKLAMAEYLFADLLEIAKASDEKPNLDDSDLSALQGFLQEIRGS